MFMYMHVCTSFMIFCFGIDAVCSLFNLSFLSFSFSLSVFSFLSLVCVFVCQIIWLVATFLATIAAYAWDSEGTLESQAK